MPRVYTSKSLKPYKRYDPLILKTAIETYQRENKSLTEIANQFKISKSVLHRHVTRKMNTPGGQKALNEEEEKYIIKYINICAEWGYPLDTYDLRSIIKGYLDKRGREVKKFKNNLPGVDFTENFLKRHKSDISERLSENIKRSREAVSPQIIEEFFRQLENILEGVPLSNIINYDETNLADETNVADDPGKNKILTKRGIKYPELVMNHTESSTSIMMAASADGTLLPCYVVYKADHLYDAWTKNGPPNCRYNHTSSGWFDANTFEDWVETVALPYFSEKEGKKIMIGDNLSSHLSLDIIKKCQELNVYFVFLPTNSTHLTQPLDVAFFRPMKIAWRDILFTWEKPEGRILSTIPKNVFPKLLKKMLEKMTPNIKQNILAGFMKAGISPLNKERVLSRLSENNTRREFDSEEKEQLDEAVLSLLKEMRYGLENTRNINRMKKINVEAGESVEDSDYADSDISWSSPTEKKNLIPKVPKLSAKGKGIAKKSKPQKFDSKSSENSEGLEGKQVLKEINSNFEFELLVISDDNFLVTEEITIHSDNDQKSQLLYEKQEEESILKQCDEPSLIVNYYNNFTEGNIVDEKSFLQQKEVMQLQKPLGKKKIPQGKRIHILPDEKIKINMEKPELNTSPVRNSSYENNTELSEPKPGTSGFRMSSYCKNNSNFLEPKPGTSVDLGF